MSPTRRTRLPFRRVADVDTPEDGDVVFFVDEDAVLRRKLADGTTTEIGGEAGAHSHAESEVTGLTSDLAGKAATSHTHNYLEPD